MLVLVNRLALLARRSSPGRRARAAQAAYPGRNGKLVFFQADIGGTSIQWAWRCPTRTGATRRAAARRRRAAARAQKRCRDRAPIDPVWSPDGTRIAFGLGSTLATMKPGRQRRAQAGAHGLHAREQPELEPGRHRIAFAAVRAGRRNVFVVDAAGGVPVAVTNAGGAEPAWSVKDEIAFVRRGDVFRIHAPCPVRPDVACPAIQYRPSPPHAPGRRLAHLVAHRQRAGVRPPGEAAPQLEEADAGALPPRTRRPRPQAPHRQARGGSRLGLPTASASCSGASTASTPSSSP